MKKVVLLFAIGVGLMLAQAGPPTIPSATPTANPAAPHHHHKHHTHKEAKPAPSPK